MTLDEFLEKYKSAIRLEIVSGLKVIIQTEGIGLNDSDDSDANELLDSMYNSGIQYSICFGAYWKLFYNICTKEYGISEIDEKEFIEASKANKLNKLKSLL